LMACQKEEQPRPLIPIDASYLPKLEGTHLGQEIKTYLHPYVEPAVDTLEQQSILVSQADPYALDLTAFDETNTLDLIADGDTLLVFKHYLSDYVYTTKIVELKYNKFTEKMYLYYHYAYVQPGNHNTTIYSFRTY